MVDAKTRAAVHGHTRLVKLLRLAHSAERAAAFAYIGHAGSVKDPVEKAALAEIEADEWGHRASVLDDKRLLPIFQKVFGWGSAASYNDVDLAAPHDPAMSSQYCQRDDGDQSGLGSNRARPSRRLRTLSS